MDDSKYEFSQSFDIYYRRYQEDEHDRHYESGLGWDPDVEWIFLDAYQSLISSKDGADIGYLKAKNRILNEMKPIIDGVHSSGFNFDFKIVKGVHAFLKDDKKISFKNTPEELTHEDMDFLEVFYMKPQPSK